MFELMLAKAAQQSTKVRWLSAMPGVKVCDFDCAFPVEHRPRLEPGRYETLFCRDGTVHLHTTEGHVRCAQKGDVLLISEASQIETVSFSDGDVRGTLVIVNAAEARGSLERLCTLLGDIQLDVKQIGRLMQIHQGCACIHGGLWSEALLSVLAGLGSRERGEYCTLKAVELLYLLSKGSLDLSWARMEHCDRHCQMELVRRVSDYIQAHLAEELSIDRLAARFHCSPTTLKTAFRQSYGLPVHHCVCACRLRRGAELLDTTAFSVAHIASEVGYSSVSQFSTMFKRRYHLSPAQYRRRENVSKTNDTSI